jgi:hypothetical protein
MKFLIALCLTLTAFHASHASNPRVITQSAFRSFSSKSEEYVKNFFQTYLAAVLYKSCVNKTLDQDRCELLPQTFLLTDRGGRVYEDYGYMENYDAVLSMRFNPSDRRANAYVKTAFARYIYQNMTREEMVESLKQRLITKALSECLRRTGSEAKCILQDKTMWIEYSHVHVDEQTRERYHQFEGTVSVVHLR